MKKNNKSYEENFKVKKRTYIALISSGILIIIGIVDYLTKSEISFSIFYIAPIALAAWYNLTILSIVFSFCSAGFWLLADLVSNHKYVHPLIPYLNSLIRAGFFLIVTYALMMLKKSLEREKELSRTDTLTGIFNSKGFYEFAIHEIHRSSRYKHPFAIAYIDIDQFQSINENHGHSTGDSVLKLIAATIRNNLRKTDICARLGGDEFGILLPETDQDAVKIIFSRVQKNLLDFLKNIGYPLTFSMGVVTCIDSPSSTDEVIKYATRLMQTAKNSGKNNIIYGIYKNGRAQL